MFLLLLLPCVAAQSFISPEIGGDDHHDEPGTVITSSPHSSHSTFSLVQSFTLFTLTLLSWMIQSQSNFTSSTPDSIFLYCFITIHAVRGYWLHYMVIILFYRFTDLGLVYCNWYPVRGPQVYTVIILVLNSILILVNTINTCKLLVWKL